MLTYCRTQTLGENWLMGSILAGIKDTLSMSSGSVVWIEQWWMKSLVLGRRGRGWPGGYKTLKTPWAWVCMRQLDWQPIKFFGKLWRKWCSARNQLHVEVVTNYGNVMWCTFQFPLEILLLIFQKIQKMSLHFVIWHKAERCLHIITYYVEYAIVKFTLFYSLCLRMHIH